MKRFASTDTLMELLESGDYKCLVMENDEEVLDTKEDIEAMFKDVQTRMSCPNTYDYFTRRQVRETKGGGNE
jgi:hypothetical protein